MAAIFSYFSKNPSTEKSTVEESPKNQLLFIVETFFKSPFLPESQRKNLNEYKKEIIQLENFNEKNFEQYLSTSDKLSKVVLEIFNSWKTKKKIEEDFPISVFLIENLDMDEACNSLDKVYEKISFQYLEKKDPLKAHETAKKIQSSSLKNNLLNKIADYFLQHDKPENALNIAREDFKYSSSLKNDLSNKIADYFLQHDKPENALNIAREDFKHSTTLKNDLLSKIADYFLQYDKPEDALNIAREDFKYSATLKNDLSNKIADYYLQHDKPEDALNIAEKDFRYSTSLQKALLEKIAKHNKEHII